MGVLNVTVEHRHLGK